MNDIKFLIKLKNKHIHIVDPDTNPYSFYQSILKNKDCIETVAGTGIDKIYDSKTSKLLYNHFLLRRTPEIVLNVLPYNAVEYINMQTIHLNFDYNLLRNNKSLIQVDIDNNIMDLISFLNLIQMTYNYEDKIYAKLYKIQTLKYQILLQLNYANDIEIGIVKNQ